MRRLFLSGLLALALFVVTSFTATESAAQSGGGCNQNCDPNGFCYWGGSGWCTQGYLGGSAACYQFFDCQGGGDDEEDLATFPTACERAADERASEAIGKLFRAEVLKSFWSNADLAQVRLWRQIQQPPRATTVPTQVAALAASS